MDIFKIATEYYVHMEISSYEHSVADIISYLIAWRHVCDTTVVNIHSPSEGYVQSNCLDVVEIMRVPDMLPSLFPSWPG